MTLLCPLRSGVPDDVVVGLTGEIYRYFGDKQPDGKTPVVWVEKHEDGHGVVVGMEMLSEDDAAREIATSTPVYVRPT